MVAAANVNRLTGFCIAESAEGLAKPAPLTRCDTLIKSTSGRWTKAVRFGKSHRAKGSRGSRRKTDPFGVQITRHDTSRNNNDPNSTGPAMSLLRAFQLRRRSRGGVSVASAARLGPKRRRQRPATSPRRPSQPTPPRTRSARSTNSPKPPRLVNGPAGNPECVWLGRRVVGLLWRDDLDTAFRHLDLYDRFGCPGPHIQATFRCVVRQGNIDPKSPESLNARVHACWLNPSLAAAAAAARPGRAGSGTCPGDAKFFAAGSVTWNANREAR